MGSFSFLGLSCFGFRVLGDFRVWFFGGLGF